MKLQADRVLAYRRSEIRVLFDAAAKTPGALRLEVGEPSFTTPSHIIDAAAKAAHDGILAALLAQHGFTAATRILEGPKGLLAAMSSAPQPDRLTAGLVSTGSGAWRIEGVSFKVHASCRHTHSAVDAALLLRERIADLADIERVDVRIYSQALGLLEGVEPTTPYGAKFSLPFCVAAALLIVFLYIARSLVRRITRLEAVMGRLAEGDLTVDVPAGPELDALYPAAWPAVVAVTLRSGDRLEERIDHPAGDPESGITEHDIAAKFCSLAGGLLGERADALALRILEGTAPTARELADATRGRVASRTGK